MSHPLVEICVQPGLGELRQRTIGDHLGSSEGWALWRAVPDLKIDFKIVSWPWPPLPWSAKESVCTAAVRELSRRARTLCFTKDAPEAQTIWSHVEKLPKEHQWFLLERSCQSLPCHEFVRLLHRKLGGPSLPWDTPADVYVASRRCCATPLRALKFSCKYALKINADITNVMVWKSMQTNRADVFRHLFLLRPAHFPAAKLREYYNYAFSSCLTAMTLAIWGCMSEEARAGCRGQLWAPIQSLRDVPFVEHVCAVHGVDGLRQALARNPKYVFNMLRMGPLIEQEEVEKSLRLVMPLVNQCTNPFGQGLGESVVYLEESETLKLLIRHCPDGFKEWHAGLATVQRNRLDRLMSAEK